MKKKVVKTIDSENGTVVVYDDGSMEELQDMKISLSGADKPNPIDARELLKKYKKMKKNEI